jgi:hypothetical protein
MPNKYSHSVVLAHYSSLGLIDLPNDQYIAYLKTYPSSRRPSISSRSKAPSIGTTGSITSSAGYRGRYTILEEHAPSPRSVTGRREYGGPVRREIIAESDEGSEDEMIILHKKHEPFESVPSLQKKPEGHELRTEKRRVPSVSTSYTARSSSEESERRLPTMTQQMFAQPKKEPKTSPPSVINLNDYEAAPTPRGSGAASTRHAQSSVPPLSGPKTSHIAGQAMLVRERRSSSITQETRIYRPNHPPDQSDEPDFAGFSDQYASEITITGIRNDDSDASPPVPRSHFSSPSTPRKPTTSTFNGPTILPKRVDSAAASNHHQPKPKQPRHDRSHESISSINSEDMRHLKTALPPVVPPKPQKPLHIKSGKTSLASRNAHDDDDAIDPRFFETLRGGPPRASAPHNTQRLTALHSNPPPSASRNSQQYSRKSMDHTPPNPDFWRGLEEMLSDSDASVVFPPDIAKHKPRNGNLAPPLKVDRLSRNETTNNGELKRPTTAPAPKTSTREAFTSNEALPEGQSRTSANNNRSLEKPRDASQLTTVQLVDTSAVKKPKRGFLRKLRKKSYKDRT